MSNSSLGDIEQCGRKITAQEIAEITETVKTFPNLSLSTLIETISEHLEWFTATGRYKKDACLKLLQKLEISGAITLPGKRTYSRQSAVKVNLNAVLEVSDNNNQEINCCLRNVKPVSVEPLISGTDVKLWDEYVDQQHYLGHKRPIGCFIRYFAKSTDGEILACVLFAGAARSMSTRDRWIGWSNRQRLRNLPWVINNSRFVIMPWVKIPYLASHILGQIGRRIANDWQTQWGYRPLLMETFVDPAKYTGTCYKASGWENIGRTTGKGLVRKGKKYTTTPKLIFTQPLTKDFREQLCSEYLTGRVEL
jgi:hypothetical protein